MLVGHEIIPGLYQRGMFKKYSLPRKAAMIEGERIGIVVCMIMDQDEELKDWMHKSGRSYVWCPIPDGKITEVNPILQAAGAVCQSMIWGRKAIIHCRAGRNRSALVSALVVRKILGCSGREAIEIVRKGRPNSLANEHFVAYLEGLDVPELHHR